MTSTAASGDQKVKMKLGTGQLYVAGFAFVASALVVYNCHIPKMLPAHIFGGFILWLVVVLAYLYFLFHDVKRYAWITPIFFVLSVLCVWQGTHIGFLLSQKALDELATKTLSLTSQQASSGTFKPEEKAGLYDILAYSVDANSGTVYLVTTYENDGIGPDTCTSGFVFKPVATESPYGQKYYEPSRISGDWYQFSASNDF